MVVVAPSIPSFMTGGIRPNSPWPFAVPSSATRDSASTWSDPTASPAVVPTQISTMNGRKMRAGRYPGGTASVNTSAASAADAPRASACRAHLRVRAGGPATRIGGAATSTLAAPPISNISQPAASWSGSIRPAATIHTTQAVAVAAQPTRPANRNANRSRRPVNARSNRNRWRRATAATAPPAVPPPTPTAAHAGL